MDKKNLPENIDAYIAAFPPEIQAIMNEVRSVIAKTAPDAGECISWAMPTFRIKKILVQFAGFKSHLGFYPFPEAVAHFRSELAPYHTGKGSIRFPYHKPVPYDLIARMVAYNREKLRPGNEPEQNIA
ncbi:MAG: DUF1801 domain-containing protein [Tannerellaceae bacterium]|jgi:uncharacterized protein YdhG (YjbR/CyaY superfamily)|nr:DUF1801 domain-containing protein [Tannerellaceae bacterium]